jgi:hypothetical protein
MEIAMCTDETRQEVLFLLALTYRGASGSFAELLKKMHALAVEFKWPSYIVSVPLSLEELIDKSVEFDYIERESVSRFIITHSGIERLKYISTRFLDDKTEAKIELQLGQLLVGID